MDSRSSIIAKELRAFFATLYAQIKLSTRDGLNDLAKNQESSLLNLINKAYGYRFKNLNFDSKNFPALDYGDPSSGLGLQMTATVSRQKFKDTVTKLRNDKILKSKYNTLMFFLLAIEPVKKSTMYISKDISIKYVTFFDLINIVLSKNIDFQKSFLSVLKTEYSEYFNYCDEFSFLKLPMERRDIFGLVLKCRLTNGFISDSEVLLEDDGRCNNFTEMFSGHFKNFKLELIIIGYIGAGWQGELAC